jgi:hypothetical protein
MSSVAPMSGSPHGVIGCRQPGGVAMKWFASCGAPRTESSISACAVAATQAVVATIPAVRRICFKTSMATVCTRRIRGGVVKFTSSQQCILLLSLIFYGGH